VNKAGTLGNDTGLGRQNTNQLIRRMVSNAAYTQKKVQQGHVKGVAE
jgi:hypothetical protein